jgi:superfamily II DNA/RNA helicase
MVTSLMYTLLREMKLNVREIHARKPQLHRTRVSDEFKESNRLILVTSDVSARGMNYPDVTLVIQVGIPSDREQYIHRLGRTGREGKGGEGLLLIAPWERYFLDELKDLPLEPIPAPDLDSIVKHQVCSPSLLTPITGVLLLSDTEDKCFVNRLISRWLRLIQVSKKQRTMHGSVITTRFEKPVETKPR